MSCLVTEAKELSSNVISNHTHSMKTNWYGIVKALLGDWFPGQGGGLLGKIKKKGGADDKNVPFCLTEEFAAVYRLHPLMPPGLVIEGEGSDSTSFVNLEDCLTAKGRELMRKPGMSKKVFNSVFHYPCGALVGANYPDAMRNISPTDMRGVDIPGEGFKIDLAAIDLYRDRPEISYSTSCFPLGIDEAIVLITCISTCENIVDPTASAASSVTNSCIAP